jgi:serine/threonine protein kinase
MDKLLAVRATRTVLQVIDHILGAGYETRAYEIQSPLGAGGMGEVYRARETRLNRTVTVKILPARLTTLKPSSVSTAKRGPSRR